MENTAIDKKFLYKRSGICIATFFGSALAGAYLMGQNLKALGRPQEVKRIYLISFVILAVGMILSQVLEHFVKGTASSTAIFQLLIIVYLHDQTFPKAEREGYNPNSFFSNWKAFGIALLCLLVLFILLFILALLGIIK